MARIKFLHVDEVVKILKLTKAEVYKRLGSGELKGHMQKRRWLINKDQPCFEDYNRQVEDGSIKDISVFEENPDNYTFGPEAERAMKLMNAGENLFITGKAGTGKTTLLQEILKRNQNGAKKNIVVLAPTGVAAENAGGMTMHHFLRIPMKPYLPDHTVLPTLYKLKPEIEEVVRNLDVLIIDEVSMVRCDQLDAIDMILKHYRNSRKPFGGVQLVMFGDLYQLSPVVKPEEWEEMKPYYKFVYFFCSYVFKKMNYKVVELLHIYRQEDGYFKNLLNNIRVADVSKKDLDDLDRCFDPRFAPDVYDDVVTLMTHVKMTEDWNKSMFSKLSNKTYTYDATAHNWWGERMPAEYHLKLKVGSRVMFLRNTDQYKNGTMGRVVYLDDYTIRVQKDSGGDPVDVQVAKWEQLEYTVDKATKTIYTEVSGTFKQFPLKLAWAVSIHKSQGLTFDEVAIDAAKSFTFGQVYVAMNTGYKGLQNDQELPLEEIHRNILMGFYSIFKLADKDLQFVLLTGVTKFSQVSVFSGFNQPDDISCDGRYDGLCGITRDELLSVFKEQIRELGEANDMTEEETIAKLKQKYDGYHFSKQLNDVFNPFSILNCLDSMDFQNFWFASGTPTYLVRLLADCRENINELIGKYYAASQFIDYKADVERPLPMIYQSGYLTIKDYNKRLSTYLLDFPNEEVRNGFIDAVASGYFKNSSSPTSWGIDVNAALENGDTVKFEKLMTSLLSSISYRFQRKQDPMECERYFQYTFFLIVKMLAFYNTVAEKETSEGRIDCVVECPNYVYVIEFKMNGSAEAALQQIEEKGYTKPYAADPRTVICLGINFSSQTGTLDGFKAVTETGAGVL